ncbi:MAG: glutamyl-tRNA reductase [Bacteroidota bacterium]
MDINQFYIAGINYRKSDAGIRGDYAIGTEQYASILEKAGRLGITELFVLSTCNRTEIYGIADDVNMLLNLLCSETAGDHDTFLQLCYIKQGREAIEHIFSVGAGLDSQILGDYEIVGQMKLAVKFSREKGFVGAFMERLFNTVLQASKAIKNETALSGGTISVSFAAIQFLKQVLPDTGNKKIVLLGTGKIGKNTCKNLVDYLHTKNIVLINRTEEKAMLLAEELGLKTVPFSCMESEIATADIVIVATNAEKLIITKDSLLNSKPKVLIDLSIPHNIEPCAGLLDHITLANVDDLSKINDRSLQKRRAEIPKAMGILSMHINEFDEWFALRTHVPILKAVKQKLNDMQNCAMYLAAEHRALPNQASIQKVVNTVAVKMRQQHQPGCYYIEAINEFMTTN